MSVKYYHTKESVDEYIELAKDVDSKQLIEKFREFTAPKSTILEIGSGPGTDWKILNNLYDVTGSDNSDEFLKRLKKKYPNNEFLSLDAISLETEKKFDGIYSNKVLHHLNDKELVKSIERQVNILNFEGITCHSFWKGEGSEEFHGMFVNYQTKSTLTNYFKQYFDILILEEYKEFEEADSIILIGRKQKQNNIYS